MEKQGVARRQLQWLLRTADYKGPMRGPITICSRPNSVSTELLCLCIMQEPGYGYVLLYELLVHRAVCRRSFQRQTCLSSFSYREKLLSYGGVTQQTTPLPLIGDDMVSL